MSINQCPIFSMLFFMWMCFYLTSDVCTQIVDLLWSDPMPQNGCISNEVRGGGCYWGPDVTEEVLGKHNLQLLIRSHECKQDGYEFCHNRRVSTERNTVKNNNNKKKQKLKFWREKQELRVSPPFPLHCYDRCWPYFQPLIITRWAATEEPTSEWVTIWSLTSFSTRPAGHAGSWPWDKGEQLQQIIQLDYLAWRLKFMNMNMRT